MKAKVCMAIMSHNENREIIENEKVAKMRMSKSRFANKEGLGQLEKNLNGSLLLSSICSKSLLMPNPRKQ